MLIVFLQYFILYYMVILSNNDKLPEDRKKLLKATDLFKNTPPQLLDFILQSLEELKYKKSQVIFNKGDLLPGLYIIEKGRVKVHDGDYQFAVFKQYDFFGEYSLVDTSERSASVTALEDTTLLRLGKVYFDELLDKDLHFAKVMLKTLIERLRKSNLTEEQLVLKSHAIQKEKEEIEEKRNELEMMNATKDKFFSIIAHDLKNPFNTIIGLSELLAYRYENYSKEKIQLFIQQIYKYSTNAYSLLDNLLQWARAQTGQLVVSPEELDVKETIQENMRLIQNQANQKEIALQIDADQASTVYADKNMVNTVLRNLFSNAIKFSHRKGTIKVVAKDYDQKFVIISVIDYGIGIEPENVDKIFDLSANFSTSGTESEEGTGLGITLCKDFVEKNHGNIWVESEKGKGSAFHFTLPKSCL